MTGIIRKIAESVWKKYVKYAYKVRKKPYSKKIAEMLMGLNPGRDGRILIQEYYIDKLSKIILAILAGILLVSAVVVSESNNKILDEENRLIRNGYGKNKYEAVLIASTEDKQMEVNIEVEEQLYREEELDRMYAECLEELKRILPGTNESLMQVRGQINTVSAIEGYPFSILWESSNYSVLHNDGSPGEAKIPSEGVECELTAYLTYKDYNREAKFQICLYPPILSEEENRLNEIIASIRQKQEETQYDAYLQLPTSNNACPISWKEPCNPLGAMLAALLAVAILGIWIGIDNDLAKKYKRRNQLLNLEYSEFVSKLQLLIGSGMTLRTAFDRMGDDYKALLKEGESNRFVYDELLICLKRIRDGASESEAYDYFGRKCNLLSYKKLMSLLNQNLKKGTSGLLYALSNETKAAFEERKQIARRMGEEAQTKLLFPMIIMLGIVMIIIMVPAYLSFGT